MGKWGRVFFIVSGGVAAELLTSNCVSSLLNIVVEMVLTVEVSSRDFVDVWVLVVLVVDVGLLKTDCVGSLLNIVVEILPKVVFVDIGVLFVAIG